MVAGPEQLEFADRLDVGMAGYSIRALGSETNDGLWQPDADTQLAWRYGMQVTGTLAVHLIAKEADGQGPDSVVGVIHSSNGSARAGEGGLTSDPVWMSVDVRPEHFDAELLVAGSIRTVAAELRRVWGTERVLIETLGDEEPLTTAVHGIGATAVQYVPGAGIDIDTPDSAIWEFRP